MNILLAPNNYYVMPTTVLLQSLFETAEEKLDIYCIHSDLTEDNIQKLDSFISAHGGAFHLIEISDTVFEKAHTSIHITKQTYYRLLNDKETARAYFEKAHAIRSAQIDTLYFLSRYDLEEGKKEDAIEKLEKAQEGRFSPLNYVTPAMIDEELKKLKA